MNKPLSDIAKREFGSNEFMLGFKKGQAKATAGTCKKSELKSHFKKLKGVLRE